MNDLAQGVAFLGSLNLAHGDLRPENILLDRDRLNYRILIARPNLERISKLALARMEDYSIVPRQTKDYQELPAS